MSLSTLNAAIDNAFARRTSAPRVKQRSPYGMLSDSFTGFPGDDRDFGTQHEQQEQYGHYKGRPYSAGRIIVHRFASQGMYAARYGVLDTSRSLSRLIHKGVVPAGVVPRWLGASELELLPAHPVLRALEEPNRMMTRFNMWEMAIGSLIVVGRGFLVALPSETPGRAFDMWPIPATWIRPDGAEFKKWSILPPGSDDKPIEVDDSQVCHFYFADPANPVGALSPLVMLARAVLADQAISAAQYTEFKNPMPKVALLAGDGAGDAEFSDERGGRRSWNPVRLEPAQRRQIITWFQQQFAGVQKFGLPIVLDAVIRDIKILSRKPHEMAFLESAGLTKEQIFEGYGVSKILTGNLENVTRASGALADHIFVDNCLNPIITLVSQALTKKFGSLFSVDGERLAVWVAPAIPSDVELDIETLRLMIRSYAITRNEVRDIGRRRFGGLPRLDGYDDVVMPERLESVEPDEERVGVGRLPFGERAHVNGRVEGGPM